MVRSQSDTTVLVTGTASDSHTWNLIYLQLFIEERGHRVVNLGPCVPAGVLAGACRAEAPDLVVLSSLNGHGFQDGLRTVAELRRQSDLAGIPIVIGGKLSTVGALTADEVHQLRAAGFDAVFDDGDLAAFEAFLARLHAGEPADADAVRMTV
jgi:methylaspartate mutase sigma subunit